ncbi:hypothetical protein F383_19122 [Gossypium arboreum]|uniref:Uncharacterized protein n=1 Tax=Gossypium arboreum TaxID=29729 RepID=A0A0B0NSW4_GOSAR|nr:hypothetical protein F383_19122 [Gossypium arboreum]
MHQPQYVSQCKTCLGHASTSRCVSVRPVWDRASTQMDES